MNIYFFLMILTFIFILFNYKQSQKKQNMCLLIVCSLWTLVWGLRGYGVGNDTPGYAQYFDGTGEKFFGYGTVDQPGDTIEPGFIVIGKFLSIFSNSPTFFFFFVAAFQFSAIYFLYRNRENSLWGFLYFFIVGLAYEVAIIATRQSISLSLVLWAVFLFENLNIRKNHILDVLKNKRFQLGVCLFIFAIFTHRTSILIFPFFVFIYLWQPTKKQAYIFIGTVFLIALIIPNSMKTVINFALTQISFIKDDNVNLLASRYEESFYSNITIVKIVLWAIPIFTSLVYTKKELVNTFSFKCLLIAIALNILLTGTTMIDRLSLTFMILGFRSLIPVEVSRNKKVAFVYVVSSLLFIARTYQGFILWDSRLDSMLPYYFFWEQ